MNDKGKITIDDITDKYIRPKDQQQKEKLVDILLKNNIPHSQIFSPKGALFKVSSIVYNYLILEGINAELVEVKNIGLLPPKERKEIKEYNKNIRESNRGNVLKKLREDYGPVDE